MPASFSLRIESGDQAGETHALGGSGLTVGRRPGNGLVLQDASVSGRHARLSIESDRIVVVDFGSTNGTFVDGQKVDEATLDPGQGLRFGKVEVSLHAGEPAPAEPAAAATAMPAATPPPRAEARPPVAAPQLEEEPADDLGDDLELELEDPAEQVHGGIDDDLDDEVHQIDAADLSRAGKGPGLLPLALGLAVVGGGAAWYFLGMPGLAGGGSDGPAVRTVPQVAGNLLADPSFEADQLGEAGDPAAAWSSEEAAPVGPWTSEAWRTSGELGLGCELEAGEWSLVRSATVRIGRSRGFEAGASAWAEDGARVRLGVELLDAEGDHPPVLAWTSSLGADGPTEGLELAVSVPPGYEQARLLLEARADGAAGAGAFDDAYLVDAPVATLAVVDGFSVHGLGAGRAAVAHVDRPLLTDLGLATGTSLAARVAEGGLELDLAGGGDLELVLDPGLLAEGLATLGEGGYRPHGDGFEDPGVTSIVLGAGVHQMRLVLPQASTVTGRPLERGFRLQVPVTPGDLKVELGFAEERARASRLNDRARLAEREGDLAGALQNWQALLDEVPFDAELVLSAEAGRARLVAAGLAELDTLRSDFERARFFGLPDLFEQCLVGIDAVGKRYGGSEVEAVAQALLGQLGAEVEVMLGADGDGMDEARRTVLELIDAAGSTELAGHLRERFERPSAAAQEGND